MTKDRIVLKSVSVGVRIRIAPKKIKNKRSINRSQNPRAGNAVENKKKDLKFRNRSKRKDPDSHLQSNLKLRMRRGLGKSL